MDHHPIVSREDWTRARIAHLAREKELTRQRDALLEERRALPWVAVDKPYVFEGPDGPVTLGELFQGRSQLIVKHFMMGPSWTEGCVGCSFEVDHLEGALRHVEHHDVAFAAIARAPIAELEAFKARMGWTFTWVSSFDSDFNFDFNVSFTPEAMAAGEAVYNYEPGEVPIEELSGLSVFHRSPDGAIHHTYSTFGRGGEEILTSYMLLDLTPNGRNETGPNFNLTDWVRHHDRYDDGGSVDRRGRYVAPEACCAPEALRG